MSMLDIFLQKASAYHPEDNTLSIAPLFFHRRSVARATTESSSTQYEALDARAKNIYIRR